MKTCHVSPTLGGAKLRASPTCARTPRSQRAVRRLPPSRAAQRTLAAVSAVIDAVSESGEIAPFDAAAAAQQVEARASVAASVAAYSGAEKGAEALAEALAEVLGAAPAPRRSGSGGNGSTRQNQATRNPPKRSWIASST